MSSIMIDEEEESIVPENSVSQRVEQSSVIQVGLPDDD
jgi:hypothetical protein